MPAPGASSPEPAPPSKTSDEAIAAHAEDLKRRILIHNEKTKLTATATNTTAVALFGGGFVLPA